MADDFENAIGYKKPPKASQFQKGDREIPAGAPEPVLASLK